MHGIVFVELERFVTQAHGESAWAQLTSQAGLSGKIYLPVNQYPDFEIKALVGAASSLTRKPAGEILESFGEFITPSLMKMYGHLLQPHWKSLDVIEHTEGTVHTVVRLKNPGATPPQLSTSRPSPEEVVLHYTSPRQMCFLAVGIGRALGRHFHENLFIRQNKCMHQGGEYCEISFRKH